jgi:hypothetical protein
MTIRRTEVPIGGTANAAGAPMRKGPGQPPLASDKSRPHLQDAREAHGTDFVPRSPEDRPRPRKPTPDEMGPGSDAGVPVAKPAPKKPPSFGGRPGSPMGRGKRR